MKRKEESPERVLSKLSDIEFKIMVIRKLNENYKELQGSYKQLTANYVSMKKDIELSVTARKK